MQIWNVCTETLLVAYMTLYEEKKKEKEICMVPKPISIDESSPQPPCQNGRMLRCGSGLARSRRGSSPLVPLMSAFVCDCIVVWLWMLWYEGWWNSREVKLVLK